MHTYHVHLCLSSTLPNAKLRSTSPTRNMTLTPSLKNMSRTLRTRGHGRVLSNTDMENSVDGIDTKLLPNVKAHEPLSQVE
jgi:hypothetical protein